MKGFAKRPRVDVAPGERVLAWTEATTGEVLAGTREALYLGGTRLAWEDVEAADWDRETEVFRVIEVGTWGEVRAEHRFAIGEPRRLLELVRERVTASVLLVRHVPLEGRRGLRVIARRSPGGRPGRALALRVRRGHRPRRPGGQAGRRERPGGRPQRSRAGLVGLCDPC